MKNISVRFVFGFNSVFEGRLEALCCISNVFMFLFSKIPFSNECDLNCITLSNNVFLTFA